MKKKTNKIGRKFKNTYNESRQRFFVIPLTFRKGLKLSIVEMKRMIIYKRWQYVALSVVAVFIVTSSMFLYQNFTGEAATYGWLQTDWSGGASATTATHTNNQTSWNQYTSKTANLSTADGVLTQTSPAPTAWTETADADFSDNGTYTNTYNDNGSVRSKKPNGLACTTGGECLNGRCASNLCTNGWYTGPCSGISVHYLVSYSIPWRSFDGACDTPQCGINGGQNDSLVSSNLVDFTLYPARNACKAVGGRLPTTAEIACIATNTSSYGNVFIQNAFYGDGVSYSYYYWTDREVSEYNSYSYYYQSYIGFTLVNQQKTLTTRSAVICVR